MRINNEGASTSDHLKKSKAFTFLSCCGTALYFPSSSLKALKEMFDKITQMTFSKLETANQAM